MKDLKREQHKLVGSWAEQHDLMEKKKKGVVDL